MDILKTKRKVGKNAYYDLHKYVTFNEIKTDNTLVKVKELKETKSGRRNKKKRMLVLRKLWRSKFGLRMKQVLIKEIKEKPEIETGWEKKKTTTTSVICISTHHYCPTGPAGGGFSVFASSGGATFGSIAGSSGSSTSTGFGGYVNFSLLLEFPHLFAGLIH